MGLEWENISADDLLLLFRSFVRDFLSSPSGGSLNGVSTGGEGEDKKNKREAEGGWGKNTPEDIVRSVKIYPSDFGLKRMEIEAVKGPCIVSRSLNCLWLSCMFSPVFSIYIHTSMLPASGAYRLESPRLEWIMNL